MNDQITMRCGAIEYTEDGRRILWFVMETNNYDRVAISEIIGFTCGDEFQFEEGKYYGLDLQEIVR